MTSATAIETAYEALKRDIISGRRAREERLRIARLASIYGFGASPLREALQRLASDGLVVFNERRGFQVAPLSRDDFLDLNAARIEVESAALRLSIESGDVEWESRVVAAAYQIEREDRRIMRDPAPDYDAWERANKKFHAALISACPSKTLLAVCARLNEHVERYRRASVTLNQGRREILQEHKSLGEAVVRRRADRAEKLLREHYSTTAALFREGGEAAAPAPRRSLRRPQRAEAQ